MKKATQEDRRGPRVIRVIPDRRDSREIRVIPEDKARKVILESPEPLVDRPDR